MDEMQEQISLMDKILKFNTKVSVLGQKPTHDEIAEVKETCKKFKGYQFDTDVSDMDFIKQISEFGNSYRNFRK